MEYNRGVKFYQRGTLPMNIAHLTIEEHLRLTQSSLPLPAAHLGESYSGLTELCTKGAELSIAHSLLWDGGCV